MLIEIYNEKHNLTEIKSLLSESIGNPTANKISAILNNYQDQNKYLYIAKINNKIVAIIGIQLEQYQIIISHIAVDRKFRKLKIATSLINYLKSIYQNLPIIAETDKEAVEFYRKNNFICTSFYGPYNLRYNCVLRDDN